ncbi:molybdate metabolism regulator [Leptospira tipperaryensis]|uniref:Molybdate metabolism regulator n=1 Tax=Leptospira tipperaryensis TaxID=2564040 RepID=A0A1D7V2W2_9LEPT|nr:molybdate metabolism regulator [Leptospira tipperaryensis]
MKRELIFRDETSDKFWNLESSGLSFTVTFGKTGTAGQTQTKTFDSEDKCRKEAEKLITEKLKKGYKENTSVDFLSEWKSTLNSKPPKEAFLHHFSFLIEAEEDKEILKKLSENLISFSLNEKENALIAEIKIEHLKNENAELICHPPFTKIPEKGLPKSYVKTVKVHNGIYFEDLGGGSIGFFGLDEKGKINAGGWEPEAIEEGDNEEFLEALENKELSVEDAPCIIEFGQNWILSDPLKKTIHKEPAYLFVSHEDCEVVTIKKANQFLFGPILLRVLAQRILDIEFFSEIYS